MPNIKQLLLEWQENPKLRLGVLLIIAILISNGLLMLDDYRLSLLEEYGVQQKKLSKLQYVQQQSGWAEKAESTHNLRLQFENGLWQAASKGLAQANVQTWFNEKLRLLHISGLELAGASVQNDSTNAAVWQVAIAIKGAATDAELLELLNHIEQNPQQMQVTQLQFNRDLQGLLRVAIQVNCTFQVPDQP